MPALCTPMPAREVIASLFCVVCVCGGGGGVACGSQFGDFDTLVHICGIIFMAMTLK